MNGFIWTRLYFLIESMAVQYTSDRMSGTFFAVSFWPFDLVFALEFDCLCAVLVVPYAYFAVFYSHLFVSVVSSFGSVPSHRSSYIKDH